MMIIYYDRLEFLAIFHQKGPGYQNNDFYNSGKQMCYLFGHLVVWALPELQFPEKLKIFWKEICQGAL